MSRSALPRPDQPAAPRRLPLRALATTLAVLLALTLSGWGLVACNGNGSGRPNVLLIVLDTMRADHCSFNGYHRPTTPGLDAFAKDATVFRNAWTAAPWTAPSHATLFTGLRVSKHGLVSGRMILMDTSTTLAERLSAAGYATCGLSNNYFVAEEFGLSQGFDDFRKLFVDRPDVAPSRRTHRMVSEWVENQSGPWFAFINNYEPHLSYRPSPEHQARFLREEPTKDELSDARAFVFPLPALYNLGLLEVSPKKMALMTDLYDAELATLDEQMDWLLKDLARQGVLDNTIVIITSDHGENLGDHQLMDHFFSLHKTLLHVPLIVRFPGHFDGGRLVDDIVRLEDVVPTVLELTQIQTSETFDGITLTRDLPGRLALGQVARPKHLLNAALSANDKLPKGKFERSGKSVVAGNLHFIEFTDGTLELYDIAVDPLELVNLAESQPEDVERLRALWTE